MTSSDTTYHCSDDLSEKAQTNTSMSNFVNMADPSTRAFFNRDYAKNADAPTEFGQLILSDPFDSRSASDPGEQHERARSEENKSEHTFHHHRDFDGEEQTDFVKGSGFGDSATAPISNTADGNTPISNSVDSTTQPTLSTADGIAPISSGVDSTTQPTLSTADGIAPISSGVDSTTQPTLSTADGTAPISSGVDSTTQPTLSTADGTAPISSGVDSTTQPTLNTADGAGQPITNAADGTSQPTSTTAPEMNAATSEIAFYGDAPAGSPASAEQVSATLGRPVAVTTFLNQNQPEQATTSWTVAEYSPWQAANPGTNLSLGVPLTFENETLQQTASGANTQEYVDVAQQLVNAGMGNAHIRLGEEMNGTWYPWGGDPADFKVAYNTAAEAMKSVPGANFDFVWNPNNLSSGPNPFQDYWPGGQNVDTVGVDAYDNSGDSGKSDISGTGGLDEILNFAEQQGKPFAVPEWGLTNSSGDDPAYINAMSDFFKTVPDLIYQGYYGDGSTTPVLSSNPQSQAAYNSDFSV